MSKDILIETGMLSPDLLDEVCSKLDSASEKLSLMNNCPIYWSPNGYSDLYPSNFFSDIIGLKNSLNVTREKARHYAKILKTGPDELMAVDTAHKKASWYDTVFSLHNCFQNPSIFFLNLFTSILPGELTDVIDEKWSEIKQKLKQLGFAEDVIEGFLEKDLGDKSEFIQILSFLTKIEKILKIDPSSWDSMATAGEEIIDAIEAALEIGPLEKWIAKRTGLGGVDAGLLIDLVVSDLNNCIENTEESIYKVLDLVQDPDATFFDYLHAAAEIQYNLTDGVLLEGFGDVIFDKADIIGSIFGLDKFMGSQTGGNYSSVKDVYNEFWETLNEFPKETITALWDNIMEQIIGPTGRSPITKSIWLTSTLFL